MSDLNTSGALASEASLPASNGGNAEDVLANFFKREIEPAPQEAPAPRETAQAVEEEPDTETTDEAAAPETEEPASPSFEPPAGLSPEQAEAFKSLTPELQKFIVEAEAKRAAEFGTKKVDLDNNLKAAERTKAEAEELKGAHIQALQRWVSYGQRLQPPSSQLALEDPAKYVAELAKYTDEIGKARAAQSEFQAITARQQAEQQAQFQRYVAEEGEKLKALIPDLAHETRGPKLANELTQFALKEGISKEQLARASAMEVKLLYNAMRFEKAQAAAATAAQKAKAEPPKAARPGNIQANISAKTNRISDLKNRVAQSGRVEDLAEIFKATDF